MPELTDEARAYFAACGKRGGHSGNHAAKGCGGSRELTKALAEVNRTRRTKAEHGEGCWCEKCTRYFSAQNKLKELREQKAGKS